MFKRLMRVTVALAVVLTVNPLYAQQQAQKVDVLLIGGGVMSATLGVLLNQLEPGWSMKMVERLDAVAMESSNGWNNAGTGHSALAELNYTPERKDGSIDISKAIEINEQFQVSRQFWTSQVRAGVLQNPRSFINATPHMSFVTGDENVTYLRKRWEALRASPLFSGMKYSEDPKQIQQWVPLVMEGRDPSQKMAATWSQLGTDVNFGEITRQFIGHLQKQPNFSLNVSSEVRDLKKNQDGSWRVSYVDLKGKSDEQVVDAKFVFVGAGGGALHLLQKSGIPEGKDYAGFPVGGSFLVTDNPQVAQRHLAKVYGKASVGSPPMSVPHLDTRVLDGKQVILFGPFATFSTKFLKEGSYLDLFAATTMHNVKPMLNVGIDEFSLVQYLAGQLMLSDDDRHEALREYFPQAKKEDWRLWQAGQRVQIIKRDKEHGGVLKLGTEIVSSSDGSIAALLGASPGASTAAPIMLDLLKRVFKDKLASPAWNAKLHELVPSYGTSLNANPQRAHDTWVETATVLQLGAVPDLDVAKAGPAPSPQAAPARERKKNSDPDIAPAPADIAL